MNQESGKIKSFTQLDSWKQAHKLALMVYDATKKFPKDEMFGLTLQLRRAAVSISSNIAEGFSRNSFREKVQFYSISLGSSTEVQNQILLARDIGYLSAEVFKQLADQTVIVNKLLNGLIKKSRTMIHDS